MSNLKKPLNILFNDTINSIKSRKEVAQGGPSRFSQNFHNFFLNKEQFILNPLIVSSKKEVPFDTHFKEIRTKDIIFNKVQFNNKIIWNALNKPITKTGFIRKIKPLIDAVSDVFDLKSPDIVFLNGFSLYNWIIMYVAKNKGVPVIIQHAGIWKKEIAIKKDRIPQFLRKIYYDMERDTIKYCDQHIFLNEFSRDEFLRIYNTKTLNNIIVPLPIPIITRRKTKNIKDISFSDHIKIGCVARWDEIKNHSAVLRLTSSPNKPKEWSVHTVVNIPNLNYKFVQKYIKFIQIQEPMNPEKLVDFYQSMDVVILPSHFDVSPTVVAESITSGTPVIISNMVGWQDEFIKNDLQDHIINTKSSGRKIVNSIKNLIQNIEDNKKKYKNLEKMIKKIHNPDNVFNKYAEIFNKYQR